MSKFDPAWLTRKSLIKEEITIGIKQLMSAINKTTGNNANYIQYNEEIKKYIDTEEFPELKHKINNDLKKVKSYLYNIEEECFQIMVGNDNNFINNRNHGKIFAYIKNIL